MEPEISESVSIGNAPRTISLRRSKWKTAAVLVAILIVMGVVVCCVLLGKMQERKGFVSNVTAGYRYRCTLSTNWKLAQASERSSTYFSAPNPIQEWISVHLFHQPPTNGTLFNGRPELDLGIATSEEMPNFIKMEAGYPEPESGAISAGIKALTAKHFRLDGCPATMATMEAIGPNGKNAHVTTLLVCPPNQVTTYLVFIAAEPEYSTQADREMQAILASFHVEKVAGTSGAKNAAVSRP